MLCAAAIHGRTGSGQAACESIATEQPFIHVDKAEKPFVPRDQPLSGLLITLDPGHGGSAHSDGYSGSARGAKSKLVEGDLNMLVAGELWHYLHKAGAVVHMTRWDDRKVTLGDTGADEELGARVKTAVNARSHLFLALHHNSAPRRSADGVVVLIWPTDSAGHDQPLERAFEQCLREEVQAEVHHAEPFKPYLQKHPLVAGSDIPSAVIEFGFLSNDDFDSWVAQRGRHRDEAIGAYNGIVRMWREHRAELEALRLKLFPDAPPVTTQPESQPAGQLANQPWTWDTEAVKRRNELYRSMWPFDRPPASAKEVQWVIDEYRQRVLSDVTFFYLKTAVEEDGAGWRIRATTTDLRLVKALEQIFEKIHCGPVRFEVTRLPAARLGKKRFGVVRIPMALIRAEPAETTPVNSQLLLGERVFLLDENADGTYLLLQDGNGYIGWVRRDAVLRLDEAGFVEWEGASLGMLRRDWMADDFRLPAGSRLPILASGEGGQVKLRLPAGVRATKGEAAANVPLDCVRLPAERPAGRLAAETAIEYLTTPYVFGGRSRLGIDCSGLTGVAYATVGLMLPRDARQQILMGQLVATPWHLTGLQPGDLVFFCDVTGRVSHAGLSLGGMRFIHSSPPEVQVSSFDPADPLFAQHWLERFAFGRRPLP